MTWLGIWGIEHRIKKVLNSTSCRSHQWIGGRKLRVTTNSIWLLYRIFCWYQFKVIRYAKMLPRRKMSKKRLFIFLEYEEPNTANLQHTKCLKVKIFSIFRIPLAYREKENTYFDLSILFLLITFSKERRNTIFIKKLSNLWLL